MALRGPAGEGGRRGIPHAAPPPWIPAFAGMTYGGCVNDGYAKVSLRGVAGAAMPAGHGSTRRGNLRPTCQNKAQVGESGHGRADTAPAPPLCRRCLAGRSLAHHCPLTAHAPPPSDRLSTASHLLGHLHRRLMPVRIERICCLDKSRVAQGRWRDGYVGGGLRRGRACGHPSTSSGWRVAGRSLRDGFAGGGRRRKWNPTSHRCCARRGLAQYNSQGERSQGGAWRSHERDAPVGGVCKPDRLR